MLSEKWEDFKAMKMVLNIIYIMVIFSTNLILWFLFLPDLLSEPMDHVGFCTQMDIQEKENLPNSLPFD